MTKSKLRINEIELINDVRGGSKRVIDGKKVTCPIYNKWRRMFQRAYSPEYQTLHPTYQECRVCDEWRYYSKFKDWAEAQEWSNRDLDKDFLVEGNKVYSPTTCLFIPQEINKFLTIRTNDRGANPLGVTHNSAYVKGQSKKPFRAQCNDYAGRRCEVGKFDDEMEAHMAYLKFKVDVLEMHMLNYTNEPLITKGLTRIRDKILFHIENNLELKSF